jgi:protein LTV1
MQEPQGEELEELRAVAAAKRKQMGFGDEDEGDYDEGDYYDEGDEHGEPYRETAEELEARELGAREQRPIDDEFELALLEYDDENLGELDPEEDPTIAGAIDDVGENFKTEIEEFATRAQRDFLPGADMCGLNQPVDAEIGITQAELTKQKIDTQIKNHTADDDDMKSVCSRIDADFAPVAKEKWDCESIISTYSNTDNHPKLIPTVRLNKKKHIKISKKTGIPIGYFPTRKPDTIEEEADSGSECDEEEDEGPAENLGEKRNKKETKAEKKARKAATKAARREKRAQKKELKQMYTEETTKLHKNLVKMQNANPVVKKLD